MSGAPFTPFGPMHLAIIVLTILLSILLPLLVRKVGSKRFTTFLGWGMVGALVVNLITYSIMVALIYGTDTALRYTLPLHICGFGVFVVAFATLTRNRTAYEISYYWGLLGSTQALLTPSLTAGFPTYWFFEYFIDHSGFVIAVAYMTWGMGMRPRGVSVPIVIGFTAAYSLLVGIADGLLGYNYMFLCTPPGGATPFFILPWPWYIPMLAVVGVVFILLAYLPWGVVSMIRKKRELARMEADGPGGTVDPPGVG